MSSKYANVTKNQIEIFILPFIPKNKRGFSPKVELSEVVQCIIYKLKTGVQWQNLLIDLESITFPFSWQLVYYYYRKWTKAGVFKQMFEVYLTLQKEKLDTENLNLDGTHSYVKKACESSAYQHQKKGKTSNILIMTDGRGIPIAIVVEYQQFLPFYFFELIQYSSFCFSQFKKWCLQAKRLR